MKPQIVPMAVGGMGVVDLPRIVLVVEFDFAPTCEALVAQHGLDVDSSSGLGARSASTCPGNNIPAAKTRPSTICLMVGIGRLRVLEVPDKRTSGGSVPMGSLDPCRRTAHARSPRRGLTKAGGGRI